MFGHTYLLVSFFYALVAAQQIQISVPKQSPTKHVVKSNFLGFSIEISFVDSYFGDGTNPIPPPMINYLRALRQRTAKGDPLRIRIGGNAGDSSPFDPSLPPPIFRHMSGDRDNQPVTYGPSLFTLLKSVGDTIGGAQYIFGINLENPSSPVIPQSAAAAATTLGKRPKNYSMANYIQDFRKAASLLKTTSAGNLLNKPILAAPAICCHWDLAPLLQGGLLSDNRNDFKYIALQHYPRSSCGNGAGIEIGQFTKHSDVVDLAQWQVPARVLRALPALTSNPPTLIMDEFNSISCGGKPGVSDTFVVGALWTADYALQLASVGYSAAHLHTREHGISYNPIDPPNGPAIPQAPFTTGGGYYAMLAVTEALNGGSEAGVIVSDLVLRAPAKDSSLAGYAIYDSKSGGVSRLVFINYGTSAVNLDVPKGVLTGTNVRYLTAASATETKQISWGGQTVGEDAQLAAVSAPWAAPDVTLACTSGCTVSLPPAALAIVSATGTVVNPPKSNHNNDPSNTGGDDQGNPAASTPSGGASSMTPFSLSMVAVMLAPLFVTIW